MQIFFGGFIFFLGNVSQVADLMVSLYFYNFSKEL